MFMKIQIDFSEVTEINNSNTDTFYLDVLTNTHIAHLYKMNKEIDLYFFEEFYMARKELKGKEYYVNELDKIIKYIDDMNLASGKRLNTQGLIDKKNEILELLDFKMISFIDIRRIQLIIKNMNSNDRHINFGPLKTVKIEILSQLPRIENTIKVIKHYNILDGKAIPVPMDNYFNLMRPKSGNNIYLSIESNKCRRVYKGCKVGPRVGEGFEYTFVKGKNKWKFEKAKSIWIS
jgi:hypothetical protein